MFHYLGILLQLEVVDMGTSLPGLGPVAWFWNSSYLGGRNLELLRSLSPGEVLRDLSSVRNSPVSAVKLSKYSLKARASCGKGFNLLV